MKLRFAVDRLTVDAGLLGPGERDRFEHELRAALSAALPAHIAGVRDSRSVAHAAIDLRDSPGKQGLAPRLGEALSGQVGRGERRR